MDTDTFYMRSSVGAPFLDFHVGGIFPSGSAVNTARLGYSGLSFFEVWATSGVVSTSDARKKEWLGGLSAAELAAAKTIAQGIGKYRWLNTEEADDRLHVGVLAQAVIAAMDAQGLDALDYGFVRYDEWEAVAAVPATDEVVEERDAEGKVVTPSMPAFTGMPGREAGNIYSANYAEIAMFIAAAQEQRLAALEALL
jgi:hypothetical protein